MVDVLLARCRVAHDDDQPLRSDALRECRLDRPCEQIPPVHGVGAHDNVRAQRGRGGTLSRGHQGLDCCVVMTDTCVSLDRTEPTAEAKPIIHLRA